MTASLISNPKLQIQCVRGKIHAAGSAIVLVLGSAGIQVCGRILHTPAFERRATSGAGRCFRDSVPWRIADNFCPWLTRCAATCSAPAIYGGYPRCPWRQACRDMRGMTLAPGGHPSPDLRHPSQIRALNRSMSPSIMRPLSFGMILAWVKDPDRRPADRYGCKQAWKTTRKSHSGRRTPGDSGSLFA